MRRAIILASIILVLLAALTVPVFNIDGDNASVLHEITAGTNPLNGDTDGDGLPDGDEFTHNADPNNPDTDGDGVKDGKEISAGTNPTNVDSDGDGANDRVELQEGTDPTKRDTDGDELSDGRELHMDSSPTKKDTDGDGASDSEELEEGTDPDNPDTDGDGLPDGREIELDSNPRKVDTDGDSLSDGREYELNGSPTRDDTDYDGIKDGREAEIGTNLTAKDSDRDGILDPQEVEDGSNPLKVDTDTDGLADPHELQNLTSPSNPDTDGDGLADGWEVAGETPNGVALPNANPTHKDIYVSVFNTPQQSMRDSTKSNVKKYFGNMRVANPDYKYGITVHFVESTKLDAKSGQPPLEYRDKAYTALGNDKQGVYHAVVVSSFDGGRAIGKGATPGYFVIYDNQNSRYAGEVVTHELLHNVIGQRTNGASCGAGTVHSCSGWMVEHVNNLDRSLTPHLRTVLTEDGFLPDRFDPVVVEPPYNETAS